MLLDALRPEDGATYPDHARKPFPKSIQEAARRRIAEDHGLGPAQGQLQRYYASEHPPGPERLRGHLLESAMFFEQLYLSAWRFSIWLLAAFLLGTVIVITLMLARGFGPGGHWGEFGIRLVIAILAFIPASQELDHALLYRMMAEQLKELIERVERIWGPSVPGHQLEVRLIGDVGDYGASTTFAPPIRTLVYKWLDSLLDRVVRARSGELNGRPVTAVEASSG